jgi:hypothetical protein
VECYRVNVLKVRPEEWEKDGEKVVTYWLSLEGREKEVPCYDPRAAELKVGEPLPDGWSVAQSKKGKDYVKTPAAQRGGAAPAFRNTKEGFLAEQEGRLRWQHVEEERRDRRTALMQAVAVGSGITTELAEKFYAWLRESVSAPRARTAASAVEGSGVGKPARVGADTTVQPRGEPQEKGAGTSPSVMPPGADATADAGLTAGGDTTSGEEQGRPSLPGSPSVSTDTSPDTAEGGTSSEEEGSQPAAHASGVKSPSRRCLHPHVESHRRESDGAEILTCTECHRVVEVRKAEVSA